MKTFWDLSFLDSFQYNSSHCTNSHNAITVTIISNSTLPFISCFILQQTDYLLLADGGANRLLAYLRECHNFVTDSSLEVAVKQLACFKNNKVWIIGDCDSITFSVKLCFKKKITSNNFLLFL
jgi:thiamine pyrophosphokinase